MEINSDRLFTSTSYGKMARHYDWLDALNYGYAVRRSRNCFLRQMPINICNPLVVGCGTGEFAAALLDVHAPPVLTINDISPQMIERTLHKIRRRNWDGKLEVLACDITTVAGPSQFDFISLNYVLDIFPVDSRIQFLKKVTALLAPGGVMQVADFHRSERRVRRLFFYANYGVALFLFWIVSGNRPNALGDLEEQFARAGLEVAAKKTFVWELYASYLLKKCRPGGR